MLGKLQELWSKTKKGADVTIVFDKSGSMAGAPLTEAKAGARAFVQTLGDRDQGSLLFFDSEVYAPFGPLPLATGRAQLFTRIDGVAADGGTALYDAISAAYDAASQRAARNPAARIRLSMPATKPSSTNTMTPHGEMPSQRSSM